MKFRKKPVIIDAIQWDGRNFREIAEFMGIDDIHAIKHELINESADTFAIFIDTLEGEHKANVGDWIIKGVKGEFYPIKDEIFRLTYDPVGESK